MNEPKDTIEEVIRRITPFKDVYGNKIEELPKNKAEAFELRKQFYERTKGYKLFIAKTEFFTKLSVTRDFRYFVTLTTPFEVAEAKLREMLKRFYIICPQMVYGVKKRIPKISYVYAIEKFSDDTGHHAHLLIETPARRKVVDSDGVVHYETAAMDLPKAIPAAWWLAIKDLEINRDTIDYATDFYKSNSSHAFYERGIDVQIISENSGDDALSYMAKQENFEFSALNFDFLRAKDK